MFSVDLGSHPRLAWHRAVEDWAPGCAPVRTEAEHACRVVEVALSAHRMVLQVQPASGDDTLLGIDLTTGAVAWRRDLPAGTDTTCNSSDRTLWCVAVSGGPTPTPTEADEYAPYDPAGPAQLLAMDIDSGRPTGSAVLGSSGFHDIVGIGPDFVLVGNRSSGNSADEAQGQGPTTVAMQVDKYDGAAGRAWSSTLPKGVDGAGYGGPPVLSVAGVDYLPYVTDTAGKGIGFRRDDGSVVELPHGMAMDRYQGQIVTSAAQGGNLMIGDRPLAGAQLAMLSHDTSADMPLVTMSSDEGRVDSSEVHRRQAPFAVQRTVPGRAQAFCGGRLFTVSGEEFGGSGDPQDSPAKQSATVRAVDLETGKTTWQLRVSPESALNCSGSDVAVASPGVLAGYDIATGARSWSVAVPAQAAPNAATESGLMLAVYGDMSPTGFAYVTR